MATFRCVLEVTKWAAPKDCLHSAALVSQTWQKAANSEELWQAYVDDLELQADSHHTSFKDVYRYCRNFPALIESNTLFLYHPKKRAWRCVSLTDPITVDKSSSWALASDGYFVCTGGGAGSDSGPDASDVYDVAFRIGQTGVVRKLASMKQARKWHGSIVVKEYCYVFGGLRNPTSTEKLSLRGVESERWVRMRDMISRRICFNPCLHRGLVCLIGGQADDGEVFHCDTETFESLRLKLEFSWSTSTFEVRGRLVILTETAMLIEEENGEFINQRTLDLKHVYANTNPIIVGDVCYILQAFKRSSLKAFNWNSGEKTKIYPSSRSGF